MKPKNAKELLAVAMTPEQVGHWEAIRAGGRARFILFRGTAVVGAILFAVSALVLCAALPAVFLHGKSLLILAASCAALGTGYGAFIWNHLDGKYKAHLAADPTRRTL
ncbi:MAG: hypothetical protein J0L75_02685 [Spirochaetes bacterium]|nr:hypothetical protein [Spirochaetota bacterium]